MILGLYAVQDTLIGFNAPFALNNDEVAERAFRNTVEKEPNASDLRLYRLGAYNDETGELQPDVPIHMLATGAEVVRKDKE